jgi:ATP-dependent DNA ligase
VLAIDGEDLRGRAPNSSGSAGCAIMPRVDDRLVYLDHVERRGVDLFTAVCAHDLEGIVAKWTCGTYHADGVTTSWLKIKNPAY